RSHTRTYPLSLHDALPILVVAYALAGRIDVDFATEPLGTDQKGQPVFLKDLWPTQREVLDTVRQCVKPEMFARVYQDVYTGDDRSEEHTSELQSRSDLVCR